MTGIIKPIIMNGPAIPKAMAKADEVDTAFSFKS